jgi:hypothetical protein
MLTFGYMRIDLIHVNGASVCNDTATGLRSNKTENFINGKKSTKRAGMDNAPIANRLRIDVRWATNDNRCS